MQSHKQEQRQTLPPQHQTQQPGIESQMQPRPQSTMEDYVGIGRLRDQVALVTGGDSGIGRTVAIAFAKEGADVAIAYLRERGNAEETRKRVEEAGRRCLALEGDVGDETFCREAVRRTLERFGRLDVLVNNAAEQHPQASIENIGREQPTPLR